MKIYALARSTGEPSKHGASLEYYDFSADRESLVRLGLHLSKIDPSKKFRIVQFDAKEIESTPLGKGPFGNDHTEEIVAF